MLSLLSVFKHTIVATHCIFISIVLNEKYSMGNKLNNIDNKN